MSLSPFVRCSDIKKSMQFYTGFLDFEIAQAPDSDPQSFMSMYALLQREGSFVHLSQHAGDGVFGNVFYIEVSDLEKIYGEFTNNGLNVQTRSGITLEPVIQTWGMKEFYVADPDGNHIRFGERVT